jgi:hypothetical protein
LNTDASASQTTWDIVNSGTNTQVCNGGGYANNSVITASCCLPNGCYDLRVFDSAGDGINPGGYVLRDAANNRIIDNVGNGNAFTTLSKAGSSFCVPISTVALEAGSCDQENLITSSVITIVPDAAVTAQYNVTNTTSGYQFWIFNPNGGYNRRLYQTHNTGSGPTGATKCAGLRLNYTSSPIPSYVLLNVRVRARVAGVYGEFGPACRIKIDPTASCLTTQLTTTATPVISCGATGVSRTTGVLWSDNVTGANRYQFEFVNGNTNVLLRRIASPTRNLNMSTWGTGVALPTCNIPYNVRVRVSFDGGVTYCPFGAFCTVTYACSAVEDGRAQEPGITEATSVFTMYPNPNRGEQLFLSLNGFDLSVNTVTVDIYDAVGQRVLSNIIPVDGGTMNTAMDLRSDIAAGLYMVNITAGNITKTERLVIQR